MKESSILERPENREGEPTPEELKKENEGLEMENGRLRADLAFLQHTLKIAEILNEHNAAKIALLEEETTTDKLTGAKNRRGFEKELDQRSPESKENIVVVLVDADKFKPINDELGHEAGDEVLREIVKYLESLIRSTDKVVRLGGDEFAIVCFGGEKEELKEKFGNGLAFDMEYKGKPLSISLSTGVAEKLLDEKIEETMHRADDEMYGFKRSHGHAR